jgi:hypothetical protein
MQKRCHRLCPAFLVFIIAQLPFLLHHSKTDVYFHSSYIYSALSLRDRDELVQRLCGAVCLVAVTTGYETMGVKRIFTFLAPSANEVLRLSCHVSEFYYYGGREDVTSISSQ